MNANVKQGLYAQLCKARHRAAIDGIVESLWQKQLIVDSRDCTVVIQALGRCSLWAKAVQITSQLVNFKIQADVILLGALTTACARASEWTKSLHCLEWVQDLGLEVGIFTVNAAANSCVGAANWMMALEILDVAERQLELNTVSCNIILSASGASGRLDLRNSMISHMETLQLSPSLVTFNTLIDLCEAALDWTAALHFLGLLRGAELEPDIISHNSAMSACQKTSEWQMSLALFQDLQQQGLRSDGTTFGTITSSCAKAQRWPRALFLFSRLWPPTEAGIRPNVVLCSSGADALQQGGQWEDVMTLLSNMTSMAVPPNDFTMSSSIGACGRRQRWSISLDLLRSGDGQRPPETIGSAIGACSRAECWEDSASLLNALRLRRESTNAVSYNAVMSSTIGSTGSQTEADGEERSCRFAWRLSLEVFLLCNSIAGADAISFNTALKACDVGGSWQGALQLLKVLQHERLQADFLSLGSTVEACAHCARWQQGVEILRNTQEGPNAAALQALLDALESLWAQQAAPQGS
ncbi:unnamed protein product [Effrenium voratum]|nr:unnamed protein product [Effrenium voratum]